MSYGIYKCGKCGGTVSKDASRCPHCGVLLSGIRCMSCGFVGGKSDFVNDRCPRCGTYNPSIPRVAPARPMDWTGPIKWTVLLALAAVLCGAIYAFSMGWQASIRDTPERTFTENSAASAPPPVSISPDGTLLAYDGGEDTIVIEDAASGDILHTLATDSYPYSLAFSADGQLLAIAHALGNIGVWSVADGSLVGEGRTGVSDLEHLAFNQAGTQLAGATESKVLLVDVGEEQLTVSNVRSHGISATAVDAVFSASRNPLLAAGRGDGEIGIHNIQTEQRLITLVAGSRDGHRMYALKFTADGRFLASVAEGGTVTLWDVASGEAIRTFENPDAISVAVSPEGRYVAVGEKPSTIRVWDADTGEQVRKITWLGSSLEGDALAYSPDGKTLISGHTNKTTQLWDMTAPDRGYDSKITIMRVVLIVMFAVAIGLLFWARKPAERFARRLTGK